MEKEKIKRVIQAFSDFIVRQQTFDVVESRYGCLVLLTMNQDNTAFNIRKYTSAEALCDSLIDFLVQEYLCEKNLDVLLLPKEYISDFTEHIKVYLEQVPEYWYLLESHIQADN